MATLLLLGALAGLGYLVLRNFLVPLIWAGILAYVSWPLHQKLLDWTGRRYGLSAALTTLLLSVAIVLPVIALAALLQDDLVAAYRTIRTHLSSGTLVVPDAVVAIPWVGPRLQASLANISADPSAISNWISERAGQWIGVGRDVISLVGRNLFKAGIALLALFFVLRDGEALVEQSRGVLRRFLGAEYETYWDAVAKTTRGVVYGLVLTAMAQGLLAGLGYWAAGTDVPVLLGALTALLALIPFGAPVVWASLGAWLIMTGELWPGVGLLLWGGLVVSWVDNFIRPWAISSATRTPFLLVLIGVLGGLTAFGLIGLFIGPMVLAVLLAVWREWLKHQDADAPPAAPLSGS
jgi:predicted PurR-regulated permease PerM